MAEAPNVLTVVLKRFRVTSLNLEARLISMFIVSHF